MKHFPLTFLRAALLILLSSTVGCLAQHAAAPVAVDATTPIPFGWLVASSVAVAGATYHASRTLSRIEALLFAHEQRLSRLENKP